MARSNQLDNWQHEDITNQYFFELKREASYFLTQKCFKIYVANYIIYYWLFLSTVSYFIGCVIYESNICYI